MAGAKTAVDFNAIIQSDRARRKNEQLAQQIFGKGRRASAPGSGSGVQKLGHGLSLADRIGSSKRLSSATLKPTTFKTTTVARSPAAIRRNFLPVGNIDAEWTHDLHESESARGGQQQRRGLKTARGTRELLLPSNGSALSPALSSQVNIVKSSASSGGLSIRGLAGPYTIIAENFAPGTTAADIESAMTPIGGPVLKCTMIASRPVTAEIAFESKDGADTVIAQFDKQIADGLVLSLYPKPNAIASAVATTQPVADVRIPRGPRADLASARLNETRSAGKYDRYEPRPKSRERRQNDDRDYVTDGSHGFDESMDVDDVTDGQADSSRGRGLYSDNLGGNSRRGRNDYGDRGRRGGSRDRGRRGDRGRGYR